MNELGLLPRTKELLAEPLLGEHDIDTKVRLLLEAEYRRRLGRYRRLDRALQQKYHMDFAEFIEQRVVKQFNYAWDVEKDAMDWETAVGGIKTIERRLQEFHEDRR